MSVSVSPTALAQTDADDAMRILISGGGTRTVAKRYNLSGSNAVQRLARMNGVDFDPNTRRWIDLDGKYTPQDHNLAAAISAQTLQQSVDVRTIEQQLHDIIDNATAALRSINNGSSIQAS